VKRRDVIVGVERREVGETLVEHDLDPCRR
jgi:hypothetical protein